MNRRSTLAVPVAACALAISVALGGCSSGGLPGGLPGAASTSNSSGGGASGCTASGNSIPAGHYTGTIKATIKTTMSLTVPGAGTLSNAGQGASSMNGTVDIVSNGKTVSGTLDLSGLGFSTIAGGQAGSSSTGSLTGTLSGPASSPIVTATLHGEWDAFGPVTVSSGSATNGTVVGLHVTSASCSAVTGDAVAMFAEIGKPVSQYLKFSGTGAWTANRK